MELFTLDRSFQKIDVIDEFESVIWTERYFGDGEVELVVPITMLKKLPVDIFLGLVGSQELMILETREIDDTKVKYKGISLLSWFNNRFIRTSEDFRDKTWYIDEQSPGEILWTMLKEMCTAYSSFLSTDHMVGIPAYSERFIIPELDLHEFDTSIEPISVGIPFGPLYDQMREIAVSYNIGMQLLWVGESDPGTSTPLRFRSYTGLDRTSVSGNSAVRFSPDLNSLANPQELESVAALKTLAFVFAPGMDEAVGTPGIAELEGDERAGFDLRAVAVYADDITPELFVGDTGDLGTTLANRAVSTLTENPVVKAVDGEIVPTHLFQYGRDYFLGDLVELQGHSEIVSAAQILEHIRTHDEGGETESPTLST